MKKWVKIFKSVRFRLTLLFSVIFGSALILTSIGSYRVVTQTHFNDFDSSLYNHAIDVAASISLDMYGRVRIEMEDPDQIQKRLLFPLQRSFLQIRSLEGHVLARSSNLKSEFLIPLSQRDWDQLLKDGAVFSNIPAERLPHGKEAFAHVYRMISYLVEKPDLPAMVLQIVAPMTFVENSQARFRNLFLFIVPLAMLFSIISGWVLSGWAFRPVKQMSKRTAEIELKNLKARLNVPSGDRELEELAVTLNMLLDRVENSVRMQERFVADASHELKTPLAIISGELDVAKGQDLNSAQTKELIESVSQEVQQLIRLTNNLLTLAKVDAGRGVILFQDFRLDELLIDLTSRMQIAAKRENVELKFDIAQDCFDTKKMSDFEIKAEPDLIRSAVQNLIDNAIKYGGRDKKVFVKLRECDTRYEIEVRDEGPGVDAADRGEIFKRFHRNAETALKVKGSGLGLSLVKRIVEIHGGSITFENGAEKGTLFRVNLPKVALLESHSKAT